MISDKKIAMQLIEQLMEICGAIIGTALLVRDKCLPDEFDNYRKKVGRVLGSINAELIDMLVSDYPELEPDIEVISRQITILKSRLEIIDGLILVKKQKTFCVRREDVATAKKQLIEDLSLSENQAQAILELKVPVTEISGHVLTEEKEKLDFELQYYERMSHKIRSNE